MSHNLKSFLPRRVFACLATLTGAAAAFGAHAAGPCATRAPLWLSLTISAGALAPDQDRDTRVRVHADGCAAVYRPVWLREPGDYRIALASAELKALRAQSAAPGLRGFDAARVKEQLSTLRKSTAGDASARDGEIFTVVDADRYELHWQDGGAKRSAVWHGLPDYAKAYPQAQPLQDFAALAEALQAIAQRGDAVRVAGAQP